MQECQVCGRRFDPFSFQVVVPELGRGFDRVECARSARGSSGPAVVNLPLAAIVEPFTAAAGPARAVPPRTLAVPAATLGLLAVGATAAAFLWLRVLGPDTAASQFSHAAAPPAFARTSIHARLKPPSSPAARPVAAREPSRHPTALSASVLLPGSSRTRSSFGSVRRHLLSRPLTRPSAPPSPDAPVSGKGHPKHGKGHLKHGETDGIHRPGHGHHGNTGHAKRHSKAKH